MLNIKIKFFHLSLNVEIKCKVVHLVLTLKLSKGT